MAITISGTTVKNSSTDEGTLLWSADYESNNLLTSFLDANWNWVPTAPTIVSSPVCSGSYAGKYTIPAAGSRCEGITTYDNNTSTMFSEGDDYWLRWSVYLGSNVPLNTTEWQVIGQFKNDGTGSPPLSLNLNNGNWEFGGGWGWPGNTDTPVGDKLEVKQLGAAVAQQWETFLFHILFSEDPAVGTVNAWRNGTQVITDWKPPGGTLYPSLNSYLKVGYYRSANIAQASDVYWDDIRFGTKRNAVDF